MRGYDQWKTASPYDDEGDPVQEAEKYLKNGDDSSLEYWIIEGLLSVLKDEGILH